MSSYRIIQLDRALQVSLQGSVDLSVSNLFKNEFEQLMSNEVLHVLVDAHSVDYIDSSGVACFLFMRKLCSQHNAHLIIKTISEPAARIIKLANLDSVLALPKSDHISSQSDHLTPNFSATDALDLFAKQK